MWNKINSGHHDSYSLPKLMSEITRNFKVYLRWILGNVSCYFFEAVREIVKKR